MVERNKEIKELRNTLEYQLKQIEKQLKEYDRNILKVLKKLNIQQKYTVQDEYDESVEIKVISYMDNDALKE